MAKVYRCDRCGKTGKAGDIIFQFVKPLKYDLCADCIQKLELWLAGEDDTGDYRYEQYDLPCPHHVPCASPCSGSAYRLVPR